MNKTTKLFLEIIGIVLVAAIFVSYLAIHGMNNKPNYAQKIAESVYNANNGGVVQATQQAPIAADPAVNVPDPNVVTVPAATVPAVTAAQPAATTAAAVQTTAAAAQPTNAPAPEQTVAPDVPTTADVTSMNKAQIVQLLASAVNKTKGFKGNLTVQHTEAFDKINIAEITGGSIVKSVANSLISSVVKPSDETLSFYDGKAYNGEGEAMSILLPQNGSFTLTDAGVANATIQRSGDGVIVDLTLVSETVGLNDTPANNAAGIGYLNVGALDLSMLTVTKADITYPGSKIHAEINADGYVTKAVYTIELHIDGGGKAGPINGTAVIDGAEVETWILNW